MNNDLLTKLQNVELNILKDIHAFCMKHGIVYSLAAGTAIGAVRHGGFIPWDDDIDITMTRGEYTKFCKCWDLNPMPGYTFQNYLNDIFCGTNHGKIRKDGTILLQEGEREEYGHHGIWVDIFPMDKISTVSIRQQHKLFSAGRKLVLLTRANIDDDTAGLKKNIIRNLIRFLPYTMRNSILVNSTNWLISNDRTIKDNYKWVSMSSFSSFHIFYDAHIPEHTTTIGFNGYNFSIFKEYDLFLKTLYGDYMVLPAESERVCKHNPIKILF